MWLDQVPYKTTLNRGEVVEKIKYPKAKIILPVVLDLAESRRCLPSWRTSTPGDPYDHLFCGLRISETARLKVTDIDSERMMVRVQQGKRIQVPLHHPVSYRP